MKKIMLFLMLLMAITPFDSKASIVNEQQSKVFLGIIIDSSPMSDKDWSIRRSRAIELLSGLEPGDKVVVIKAGSETLWVYGRAVVGGPEKTGLNEIVTNISAMNKNILFPANLLTACKTIRDIFTSEGKDFQCCLAVLTNSNMNDFQAQNILMIISSLKEQNSSICFTYDPAVANQYIINAGKRKDFEIRLASNPELAYWLQSIKQKMQSDQEIPDVLKSKANTFVSKQTIKLPAEANNSLITIPFDSNKNSKKDDYPKKSQKVSLKNKVFSISAIVIGLLMLCLMAYYFVKGLSKPENTNENVISEDCIEYLKATAGEQDFDLGPMDMVSELTIGSDPGCSLHIENEELPAQQARIYKSGKGFKIENIDISPITVNGEILNSGKKLNLNFPADIELTSGLMVNLFVESIQKEKETTANEKYI
ncbi:MAG: hypothetical protein A2Y10_08320 [Planctomycetes bacterium GWF2_41_51]|nr:MAG: hypothetical protein A2Y10_08320 [Planctomycetes bacterium GWF2_41_51]HBG25845.1 hypothetical protein [Phycisphaerales bacterium]